MAYGVVDYSELLEVLLSAERIKKGEQVKYLCVSLFSDRVEVHLIFFKRNMALVANNQVTIKKNDLNI